MATYSIAVGLPAEPVFLVDPATGLPYAANGGTSSNPSVVVGPTASGSALTASPVTIGGRASSATPSTVSDGQVVNTWLSSSGSVMISVPNSANADGLSNTTAFITGSNGTTTAGLSVFPSVFNGGNGWDRLNKPRSTARLVSSANSTNATLVKNSKGDLFNMIAYNTTAAVIYLKLYNKSSAPTVGTDTPIFTIPLPPTVGFAIDFPFPAVFQTGIGYGLTTGSADGDTGAVAAGAVVGLNFAYA